MPLARIKMTAERSGNEACRGCARRGPECHAACAEYAAETIAGILSAARARARRQFDFDMYHIEQDRYNRRGAR